MGRNAALVRSENSISQLVRHVRVTPLVHMDIFVIPTMDNVPVDTVYREDNVTSAQPVTTIFQIVDGVDVIR